VSIALDRIFGRMAERPTIDAFLCMFDNEDDLEARMFPALHKIILGLSSINLQQQLELSTSTIDDKDSNGRTALSWSATRGDAEAVKTLLSYGANPNECSHRGETSLHWAARSITKRSGEIMEALLKSGAKVNQMDCWKRTALIYASCDQEDPAFLRPLIDTGANLNMRDCHDRTALGYAAKRGRARVLEFLLSYGADASIPDTWGYTPLFEGVQQNHHQVLQILLQCNQGSDSRVIGRNSIAHLVSKYGDVKTMRLLTNENVMGLDIHERNDDGFTPQDLFLERNHLTGELEEAFQSYIGLVDTRFRRDSENPDRLLLGNCIDQSDSESVDEFSDALEYQDAQLRLGDMEDNGSGAEKIGENHALMVG